MKSMRWICHQLIVFVLAYTALLSTAHAFVPEPGLWIIDSENTGQPGRGFFIDIQGSTLVLSVYAYTNDRDAQWYQAAGVLSNNQVNTHLDIFEGGTAFGQTYRAAIHLGSVGNVSLKFNSPTAGTIQFPGEAAKAFSRFNFARPVAFGSLDGTYILERTTVKLANSDKIFDSKLDIIASGTMVISGNNVKTRFTMTYNGRTQSQSNAYAIAERDAASITAKSNNGTLSRLILVKQGDELITLGVIGLGLETDYWRRTSAAPNELALHSLTNDDVNEVVVKNHDIFSPGFVAHEMLLQ